ncbi:ferritin [Saccharicrinis sp. FJH62]|uniref:ferritin n=1 Tax=Saccharicrinis sp. FJH62 TaxID=3344657 RepID=UPI0035D4BD35
MLKEKVEKILVEQIGKEAYSSNLYLAMASWAECNGYPGIAQWMYAQSDEERVHMLKFVGYLNERGGKAVIPAIDAPPVDFKNVRDLFQRTMEHEQYISDAINTIVAVCHEERDFATHQWVQWFVNEQIEEEASVSNILDRLNLIGDSGNLYLFDRDIMGMRNSGGAEA